MSLNRGCWSGPPARASLSLPSRSRTARTGLTLCLVKATDENLASEDWALNIDVCDRVSGDGQTGYVSSVHCLQPEALRM